MILIAILDLFILLMTLISLFITVIGWKYRFSIITRLSLLAFLCIISFYYLSNFLEWSGISEIFVSIEDYVAILAPLAWFFFVYTYLQKENEINILENQKNIEEAYRNTEFYKDLFTHDIRNILQNIQLANDLIEQSKNDEKQMDTITEIFTLIREQILRGENLISNVTNLSKIRNSELPIEPVDLNIVLESTIKTIKKSYDHRKLFVQINKADHKFVVKANDLLGNIFENILLNAIMHNKNDTIVILIKISEYKGENTSYIKTKLRDNGIGIPDDRKKEIFITREEEKSKFKTGLGLSFVKKIVEYYNGKIWVEDRIKGDHTKGSNFILLISEA